MATRIEPENLIATRYSLLSRIQDWGDQASWKDFFDTYWRLIYSVAKKAGLSDAEAHDVVQETVLTVARQIQKFERDRSRGSFKGWLRNIIRWRIADQFHKRDRALSRAFQPSDEIPDAFLNEIADPKSDEADQVWEEQWREHLFNAAVDRVKKKIPEERFQMFDLYVLKSWPVLKVARMLGVNPGQVYLAKHRVASLLKEEIRALEKESV